MLVPTSAQPSTASRARRRARARRSGDQHHPASARPYRPRDYQHIFAGDRSQRDHRRRPLTPPADDLRHRRADPLTALAIAARRRGGRPRRGTCLDCRSVRRQPRCGSGPRTAQSATIQQFPRRLRSGLTDARSGERLRAYVDGRASTAIASIETSRPRGRRTLAGADRAGGGSGMCRL
jgi:hypothetical protein